MQLPIIAYGHSILRKDCLSLEPGFPELDRLISDMWTTMYGANGCGLAAPQVNVPVRLFIVDSKSTFDSLEPGERLEFFEGDEGIQETFINAELLDSPAEKTWSDEEGCLSIPGLRAQVVRPWSVTIRYQDRSFNTHTRTFHGTTARMIQHEYDHTRGILYLDHLKPVQRALLKNKLKRIAEGRQQAKYPMKFL